MDAQYSNPYLQPQTSLGNRAGRLLWNIACALLFRLSPRPCHAWRALVLRCFGARLGRDCHIYPGCTIWAPWNLQCEDGAAIADGAVIYNAAKIHLGVHAIVSQQAYLCTATHDLEDPAFPMITAPISVGSYAWICARACVLPGVIVREGAVLALGSVTSRSLDPWQIYAGAPARRIRARGRHVGAIKVS
jgi:putative colanic acid biosynthesis acetyltransferase WcaF